MAEIIAFMAKITPQAAEKIRKYEKDYPTRAEFFTALLLKWEDDESGLQAEISRLNAENRGHLTRIKELEEQIQDISIPEPVPEPAPPKAVLPPFAVEFTESGHRFLTAITGGDPADFILYKILTPIAESYPKPFGFRFNAQEKAAYDEFIKP